MGFRLNLKWVFSVQSPTLTNSSPWGSSYSFRIREASYDPARILLASVNSGEIETFHNDLLKTCSCSTVPQTLDNDYPETAILKVGLFFIRSDSTVDNAIVDNIATPTEEDRVPFLASSQASKASHFSLLLENLIMLETAFTDSDAVRLERDILVQLERLGALKLFHTFLSRALTVPTLVDLADASNGPVEKPKNVVRSGKKEERRARRQKALEKANKVYGLVFHSKSNHKRHQQHEFRKSSNFRGRRIKVTRDEAEMSRGVKLVANLERIRVTLERETGQVASLSSWAEAAGISKMVLQENLYFGWHCRDELLRSARSLVIYLARNYWGLGVAFEDIIQVIKAGNFGVLQGAERFDHTRGYKFSTYVQYWIRKSMSDLMARHARGIRIPFTLSKAINQIQKARKALSSRHEKYPGDGEIAKLTGLSLAKITSAGKCLRVVGSVDQKVGHFTNAKFSELIPDTSIKSPEEAILRHHMMKDIYDLLKGLDPRERQVLILRFGLEDHQRKSLEEIGRLFGVSKEWIRKIERTALRKLRDEETLQNLNPYLYM
ncbi:hypothetical protein RJ639_013592 [Escallonia herrerae]|uniref:Sigma factor n=1 Tax=Escallonia herrerae TaxID=1293975 RepID=A0AA89ANG8_9ASTE|nr:hypothetical protein RJ639_013592 [Escallonia herrerae]